ncbi:MAG: hypothetical protein AAF211_07615 [Myxococcota bacterium]
MVLLVWLGSSWVFAQAGSWEKLARDLATADAFERRAEAAEALHNAPPEALAEVARHVLHAIAWHPDATFPFRGSTPLFPALKLNEHERGQLLAELMAHRLALTLRARKDVPERLEVELRALLYEELEAYGEPQSTLDWVHLFGAAGGDVAALVDRLDLGGTGTWAYVVAEDASLRDTSLRETLGLLGHRSAIVRTRAARQFEAQPTAAARALKRAWRLTPGRSAPLRGDVAVPALPWEYRPAMRWSRQLVGWARRSQRQRDDSALRATLHLLTQPGLTSALPQHVRERIARSLVRYARSAPRSQRAIDLGQGMDAVLRKVSFEEGERPAPEEIEQRKERWARPR